MGDGAKLNKGLVLCTDSFSISDVIRLSNVLRIKYGLETSIIGLKSNKPRIYILAESMPNLIKIVKPYILKSFWFGINFILIQLFNLYIYTWPTLSIHLLFLHLVLKSMLHLVKFEFGQVRLLYART